MNLTEKYIPMFIVLLHIIILKLNYKLTLITFIYIIYYTIKSKTLFISEVPHINTIFIYTLLSIMYLIFIIKIFDRNCNVYKLLKGLTEFKFNILYNILFEEIIYRAYMFNILKNLEINEFIIIIVMSVVFTGVHSNMKYQQKIEFFVFSVLLNFAYIDTKSLIIPIVIHFIRNTVIINYIKVTEKEEDYDLYKQ